jgi:hypothetical protein
VIPQTTGTARGPGDAATEKGEFFPSGFVPHEALANDAKFPMQLTFALWENFLKHVEAGNQGTLSTPELGAAAFSTVNMGVQSYRNDKVYYWDKDARKPNQIQGWTAGDTGSTLTFDGDDRSKAAKEYMKLAGPWVNGKDPAGS